MPDNGPSVDRRADWWIAVVVAVVVVALIVAAAVTPGAFSVR